VFETVIIWSSDNKWRLNAAKSKSLNELRNKGAASRSQQEGLGAAHPSRTTGGENQSGNHGADCNSRGRGTGDVAEKCGVDLEIRPELAEMARVRGVT